MENDLISRSALLEFYSGAYELLVESDPLGQFGTFPNLLALVVRDIKRAPAVDAVEVVRCKDCESFGVYQCSGNGYCRHDKGLIDPYPEDFCSYGERREDDAGI